MLLISIPSSLGRSAEMSLRFWVPRQRLGIAGAPGHRRVDKELFHGILYYQSW